VRLAPRVFSITFPRVTPPLTPRVDRAARTPPERRALQDALAWPIAATLLVGAACVFFLPRVVPSRFLAFGVGGVFALTTVAQVAILAIVVERWLRQHAATVALDAERQVQTVGIAGLPTAQGDGALIPLASAYADAGARAALRSAERDTTEVLAQLGSASAAAYDDAQGRIRETLSSATDAHAMDDALAALAGASDALRQVTARVPIATHAVDVVAELRQLVAELESTVDGPAISTIFDTERCSVVVDQGRLRADLRAMISLARSASPPDRAVTLHVSRVFRANIEETPVRRTGDSRLTIVPRASGDVLRTWVLRAQPPAEVLSIVITDTGPSPTSADLDRAFDPFAGSRPGDPYGVILATVRRSANAANGTIWVDGAREGGMAIHLLLPVAAG